MADEHVPSAIDWFERWWLEVIDRLCRSCNRFGLFDPPLVAAVDTMGEEVILNVVDSRKAKVLSSKRRIKSAKRDETAECESVGDWLKSVIFDMKKSMKKINEIGRIEWLQQISNVSAKRCIERLTKRETWTNDWNDLNKWLCWNRPKKWVSIKVWS